MNKFKSFALHIFVQFSSAVYIWHNYSNTLMTNNNNNNRIPLKCRFDLIHFTAGFRSFQYNINSRGRVRLVEMYISYTCKSYSILCRLIDYAYYY